MTVRFDPAELNHHEATANLYVEGLALTHFDIRRTTWTINFLRNSDHTLTLSIRGNGVDKKITLDRTVKSLRVSTVDGVKPDFNQFPNGYWFSNQFFFRRTDLGHPEDFRWVANLANRAEFLLHALVRPGAIRSGSAIDAATELSIPDIVFYTHHRTDYPVTLSLSNLPDFLPLGRTNTTIGADILCKEGGAIVITINGRKLDPLPHVPGSPYQITFENSDDKRFPVPRNQLIENKFLKGDFGLYYEFVDVFGAHYDMLCPSHVYYSSDCDCNPAFVSRFD
jgi:hypothetical protein